MTDRFCPHYPPPQAERPSAWRMFFSKRRSWLDALYARSYHMKMGEVHLPGVDLYMVNEPSLVRCRQGTRDTRKLREARRNRWRHLARPLS